MAIQQRFGREAKLTVALFLLGISTAGIAFLPSYGSLGFTAIVLLSIFRVGQASHWAAPGMACLHFSP